MGFSYNSTFDNWIETASYKDLPGQQVVYDKMADWAQNYQYPFIYLGQTKVGDAISTDWEYTRVHESISFALVKYVGGGGVPPLIPGFLVGILLATSLVAMLGLITVIKRKQKL